MERMFQIREIERYEETGIISEAELIRRLNLICDEMHSPARSIEILLHGEISYNER